MKREVRTAFIISALLILALLLINIPINSSPVIPVLAGGDQEKQEVRSELLGLSSVKQEMAEAGMGTSRAEDLIAEGFVHLNNNNLNMTQQVIFSVYDLRDTAFKAQSEISFVEQLYHKVRPSNISLGEVEKKVVEWNLNKSQEEFDKENYEGALEKTGKAREMLVGVIAEDYAGLNNTLLSVQKKIQELELGNTRIKALGRLLAKALSEGSLDELEMLEQETEKLNKSITLYADVKSKLPVLKSSNLSVQRIEDGLRTAEMSLEFADYETTLDKLESLKTLSHKALELKQGIAELENTVAQEEARLGTTQLEETRSLLGEGREELVLGNYEGAETKLESAETSFESVKAEYLIKRAGSDSAGMRIKDFINEYWAYILLLIMVILLVLKFSWPVTERWIKNKRRAQLRKELETSEDMVKELQKKYFVQKKIGKDSYDQAYERMQEKIMKLKDKLSETEKK